MSQLKLPQKKSRSSPALLPDVSGFGIFYPLLRVLVAVQDQATFYERLRILLLFARWQGDPPTVHTIAKSLGTESSVLAQTLHKLRSAGWLISGEDDRR